MKRLIALVLLIVCCNTWAFGFNKVESDVVEPFWVAKVSVDGMTVVLFATETKKIASALQEILTATITQ